MASSGNGIQISREISLSAILQVIVIIATATAFWVGLSGRLTSFEQSLLAQARDIAELQQDFNHFFPRGPSPNSSGAFVQ